VIHALIMGAVVKLRIGMYGVGAQRRRNSCNTPSSSWRPEACSSPANFLEVPLGFHLCGGRGRAPGTDLIYFALGNYTTLGYSDVLPLEHWRCSAR
jgi:hypothetical protein